MKRIVVCLLALALFAPLSAFAAPQAGGWQLFTMSSGLVEQESYSVAPDSSGGVWVGHVSGGRGVYRTGGLTHIRADGSFQQYRQNEPFVSCSSVDALAPTQDGGLWLWLSGYHDYGHNDHQQTCAAKYGIPSNLASGGHDAYSAVALGYIGRDGAPQMLSKEQIPQDITQGLAVDAQGRPWVGTASGVAVRESNGQWRAVPLWSDDAKGTRVVRATRDGRTLGVGSGRGDVALIALPDGRPEQVTALPQPANAPDYGVSAIAHTPDGLAVIVRDQLYVQNKTGGWNAIALPGNEGYGQSVAYAGGTLWVGSPFYGLQRLSGGKWDHLYSLVTPLPSEQINDLRAVSDTHLLIATEQGVARLDTSAGADDPHEAQRAFDSLWRRTNTSAGKSWVWGPRAWSERYEAYREGPGGTRYVRYYDKARMELNDPNADPNAPWYVTNGLLVVEMVTGRVQRGNDPTRGGCGIWQSHALCPSYLQVAGDLSAERNLGAARYSDFAGLLGGVESRIGQPVAATLTRPNVYEAAVQGTDQRLATAPTTLAVYDDVTQHNVPQAFVSFMQRQPVDALFAFGRPIAEPYWVRTAIGGRDQWTLVQLFERRVLTYTPGNSPEWQVEMGNVGQHYFTWRYGVQDPPPWQ